MKPIGYCFYYELELEHLTPQDDSIFHYLSPYDVRYVDCGRSALRALSERFDGEVLLPDYSCSSVEISFPTMQMRFYHVRDDFSIDFDHLESQITPKTQMICVNQFCGKLLSPQAVEQLLDIKQRHHLTLLEDTTHSLLSAPLTFGDYGACCLYKWFPVPSGGAVYCKGQLPPGMGDNLRHRPTPQRAYAMIAKTLQLRGQIDCQAYIDETFERFDAELTEEISLPIAAMTPLDRFLLSCFRVETFQKKRKENLQTLLHAIDFDRVRLVYPTYTERDCLFCLPIYVDAGQRDGLRAYLRERQIFAPVYWNMLPSSPFSQFPETVARSQRILSLPLDHRYGQEDMLRLADAVNSWQKRAKA